MNIIIYGNEGCHYCKQAVKACEASGVDHEYIDVDTSGIGVQGLVEMIGHSVRSVPQIFDGEEYLGGFMELLGHLREHAE